MFQVLSNSSICIFLWYMYFIHFLINPGARSSVFDVEMITSIFFHQISQIFGIYYVSFG